MRVSKENVMIIKTNRALGIAIAAVMFAAVALGLTSVSGCASSDKPAPAAVPAAPPPQPVSLSQIKMELVEAKAQLQQTNDALNKLQKSSPGDAQANYNYFSEEYVKLQAKSDALAKRSEDLKKKAADYYAEWDKQVAVQNPELRRQAVQQKAQAEQAYSSIKSEMELARLAFNPYMSDLKDVGAYLKGNLNQGTLNSAAGLVEKANAGAKEVDGHLAAIIASVDKILAGQGQATPAAAVAPTVQ
jgi:hypothetical protein